MMAEEIRRYRRSLILLMVTAAHKVSPDIQIRVQHTIENGFYCEIYNEDTHEVKPVPEGFLDQMKQEMHHMADEAMTIREMQVDRIVAQRQCEEWGMAEKALMLKFHQDSMIAMAELNGYYDYFYGSLMPSTYTLHAFDMVLYQNGFMLLYPDERGGTEVRPFKPSNKLFQAMEEGARWGEMLGIRSTATLDKAIIEGRIEEIILVQEALMEAKISDVAEKIADNRKIKFVMIAGPSSSGKTTFSHRLSIQLRAHGLKPHPIALDDFYVNREDTPKDEKGEYDFEALEAIDLPLLNDIMKRLLAGEECEMPTYNFKTGLREYRGNTLKLDPEAVLVLEGIHGLNDRLMSEVDRENKFKIYISALTQLDLDYHNNLSTTDCRLLRRMVRDARTRNISAEETLRRWGSVRRGEDRNIFPFQEDADLIFNSALIYETAVLKPIIEPLLFSVNYDSPVYSEARRLLELLKYFLPVSGEQIGRNSILREFIGGSCFQV